MLARLQRFEWPFAGDVDASLSLAPYPGGHTAHVIRETAKYAASAREHGAIQKEDERWIAQHAERALSVAAILRPPVFVHGDFKPGNLTLSLDGVNVEVSGVFDLHESRVGDGASDICRQTCSYLDVEPEFAGLFVDSYRAQVASDPTIKERMPLYVANDRIKFWNFFARPPEVAEWAKGKTFRGWAQRYVDGILALL
jgi:aminoglycoside phosphotransferase (APT) family kinase protein